MIEKKVQREGYWSNGDDYSQYPTPVGADEPWLGKDEFLLALTLLELKAKANHYKGSSECRICKKRNGSSDFEIDGWKWPSGYQHYIRAHNVRPSLAFQEFVLGRML